MLFLLFTRVKFRYNFLIPRNACTDSLSLSFSLSLFLSPSFSVCVCWILFLPLDERMMGKSKPMLFSLRSSQSPSLSFSLSYSLPLCSGRSLNERRARCDNGCWHSGVRNALTWKMESPRLVWWRVLVTTSSRRLTWDILNSKTLFLLLLLCAVPIEFLLTMVFRISAFVEL